MSRTARILSLFSVILLAQTALAAEPAADKNAQREARAQERFGKTDTDHDGALSREEWNAKSNERFAQIDANKDGKISADEMKTHRKAKQAERAKRKAEKKAAATAPQKK